MTRLNSIIAFLSRYGVSDKPGAIQSRSGIIKFELVELTVRVQVFRVPIRVDKAELTDWGYNVSICQYQTFPGESMPNVHLTKQMENYILGQIRSGSYANLSEVVRAGMRLLMERDNARQFYALKANLEEALREAEAGGFEVFDSQAYEPDSGTGPS